MASSPFIFPTTGVLPGLELVTNLNTALQLLATNNASSIAPVDPFLYQLWYNTATGQLTQWNGTEWVPTTFGAPLSSVNIISGGMTVTVDNLGTILEAQGATSYTIALPDPADFPSGNVAVFNNTTGGNNITVTTASGNFIGLGVTGASVLLPSGFFALFISDGFNWVVNSTLGNALLNGSANQVFNVANAVQASNAVPLSQAQALFAALNGNTANAFAVANAPSANYAINLGQANSLYAQLAQSNTFEGVQNFASGVTTVAGAGGVSAGTLPSGANGFVQANLPATFSGDFEQYYKGGTQVYSLDSSGNITANSLTAPTLNITGTATVPTATAVTSALQLQQVTNSTLNAAFANVQAAGNVNGSTISGGTVSGSTVAGGTGSFNSFSAQTASINALSALNASLTNINATSIYGQTVSGATLSGALGSFTNLQAVNATLSNALTTVSGAFSSTITQQAGQGGGNQTPFAQIGDVFGSGIVSGLHTVSGATLTGTLSSGTAYVDGQRVVYGGGSYTVVSGSTSYLDLSWAGVLNVTTGTLTPDSLRLWEVVSSATAITSVTLLAGPPILDATALDNAVVVSALGYTPLNETRTFLRVTNAPYSGTITATTSTTGGTLPASTTYYYWISPGLADGPMFLPVNTANVTTGSGTTNSNTVSWTAQTGAVSYSVYRSTTLNPASALLLVSGVSGLSYTDTGAVTPSGTPPGYSNKTFTQIPFSAVAIDTSGGWNIATQKYTIPITGKYLIISNYRYSDNSPTGISYSLNTNANAQDSPSDMWFITPTPATGQTGRNGAINTKLESYTAGTTLQMFSYAGAPMVGQAASLDILFLGT